MNITGLPNGVVVYCRIEGDLTNNPNAYGWTGACDPGTASYTVAASTINVNFDTALAAFPLPNTAEAKVGIRLFASMPGHAIPAAINPAATLLYSNDTVFNPGTASSLTAPVFSIPAYDLDSMFSGSSGSITGGGTAASVTVTFTNTGNGPISGLTYNTSFAAPLPAGTSYSCITPGCAWNATGTAVTFTPALTLAPGASHSFTLQYSNAAGGLTVNDLSLLPASTGGLSAVGGPVGLLPMLFATGGVASVPATGALALGGMAALIAFTPALVAARRRRRNP